MKVLANFMLSGPEGWYSAVSDPLEYLWAQVVRLLPSVVGAIALFLVIWIVAVVLRFATRKIAGYVRVDALIDGTRIGGLLRQMGDELTLSRLLGALVYYTVLISGLAGAADILGLSAVRDVVRAVVAFLPKILSGILALAVGAALASVVAKAVGAFARQASSPHARLLEGVTEFVLMIVVVTVSLDLLGADLTILHANVTIFLGSFIVATAFLAAWGMRRPAEDVIANYYVRRLLAVGDQVERDGKVGSVERFTPIGFVFKTSDGREHLVLAKEYLAKSPSWKRSE